MKFWTAIAMILILSAVGLTYEIAAGRVLAPFFGTSLVTWTVVIATVLAGFSLGNAIGGFVAERERKVALRIMRAMLVATAILAALSPTILGLIYGWGARGTWGMVISVIVAFFPASVLISAPSPLLARLAVEARPGREGSSLGMVLAAGSLGAILGAVLAGFVALPFAGSVATFAACGVAVLVCLPFLREAGDRSGPSDSAGGEEPPSFAPLLPVAVLVAGSAALGPVCRYESGLSCIDVTQTGGVINLFSDRSHQAAERVLRRGGTETAEADSALALPYTQWIWARMERDLGAAPSVLFIGGGGYTLPLQLLSSRPGAEAVAVEIDPLITDVVRENLPRAGAMIAREGYDAAAARRAGDAPTGRLGIIHADGRVYINETTRRYDAAVVDAFSSESVPAHLVTRETFARLRAVVRGPIYVNLIDAPDGPLARGTQAILKEIYPQVIAVQGPLAPDGRGNVVLAASDLPLAPLAAVPQGYAITQISPARPFTDDRGWVGYR